MWEESSINCLGVCDHSQKKTWESLYICKLLKSIRFKKIVSCCCLLWVRITNKVEAIWRIYKGEDVFLQLPTSFGKSVHYEVLSFTCLTVKKNELGIGWSSYVIVLVVSPLVSLMISKFISLSIANHSFVAAIFSALYKYVSYWQYSSFKHTPFLTPKFLQRCISLVWMPCIEYLLGMLLVNFLSSIVALFASHFQGFWYSHWDATLHLTTNAASCFNCPPTRPGYEAW